MNDLDEDMNRPFIQLVSSVIFDEDFTDLTMEEFGLWVWALCYSNERLLDGRIPRGALKFAVNCPKAGEVADALVDKGRFDDDENGDFQIRNYLKYNRSKADIESIVEERRAAGRKGGLKSGETRRDASKQTKQVASICLKQNEPIDHRPEAIDHIVASKKPTAPEGYQELVTAWHTAFTTAKGCSPVVNGRNGKAAKELLRAVGLEVALECVANAFADDWFRNNSSGDLWAIASNVNKYRVAKVSSLPGGATYTPGLKAW